MSHIDSNDQFEYSSFVVKDTNRESGSIYLRISQVSCFMLLSLTMMSLPVGASRCACSRCMSPKRFQTRLAESLHLFESVVNSRWFLRTSIILFLTDMAEFGTKIHEVYWKLAYLLACIQESLISSGASGSILSGIYGRYRRQ